MTACPTFFAPIVVDDVMYVLARDHSLVAIDATTGRRKMDTLRPRWHLHARDYLLGR